MLWEELPVNHIPSIDIDMEGYEAIETDLGDASIMASPFAGTMLFHTTAPLIQPF